MNASDEQEMDAPPIGTGTEPQDTACAAWRVAGAACRAAGDACRDARQALTAADSLPPAEGAINRSDAITQHVAPHWRAARDAADKASRLAASARKIANRLEQDAALAREADAAACKAAATAHKAAQDARQAMDSAK